MPVEVSPVTDIAFHSPCAFVDVLPVVKWYQSLRRAPSSRRRVAHLDQIGFDLEKAAPFQLALNVSTTKGVSAGLPCVSLRTTGLGHLRSSQLVLEHSPVIDHRRDEQAAGFVLIVNSEGPSRGKPGIYSREFGVPACFGSRDSAQGQRAAAHGDHCRRRGVE